MALLYVLYCEVSLPCLNSQHLPFLCRALIRKCTLSITYFSFTFSNLRTLHVFAERGGIWNVCITWNLRSCVTRGLLWGGAFTKKVSLEIHYTAWWWPSWWEYLGYHLVWWSVGLHNLWHSALLLSPLRIWSCVQGHMRLVKTCTVLTWDWQTISHLLLWHWHSIGNTCLMVYLELICIHSKKIFF